MRAEQSRKGLHILDFPTEVERLDPFGSSGNIVHMQLHGFPLPGPLREASPHPPGQHPLQPGHRQPQSHRKQGVHFLSGTALWFPQTQHLKFKSCWRCSKEHQLFIYLCILAVYSSSQVSRKCARWPSSPKLWPAKEVLLNVCLSGRPLHQHT